MDSRNEEILSAMINGSEYEAAPQSRIEELLLLLKDTVKNSGSGNADLSGYYTKPQVDSLINGQIDVVTDKTAINACTLGYTRKNLLKVTASTITKDGVTMAVDSDGVLTLSGTATARTVIPITSMSNRNPISGLPTNFILSGGDNMLGAECCIGVEISTGANSGYVASFYDGDNGRSVDLSEYTTAKYWYAYMRIYEGVNVDGITIYPMIRPSDISNSDFEPYTPSVTDYIASLEARIAALESN